MTMVTAVSPRGQNPPRHKMPGAPRLESLDGKTVYVVDVRWPYTREFVAELHNVLSERHPNTTYVVREKTGPYGESDPRLWAEISEKGDAAIIAVGH